MSALVDRVMFGDGEQASLRLADLRLVHKADTTGAQRLDPFAVKLGIAFVPVSPATKAPYHPDWTNRRFAPEDFAPRDSVGALWGELSGGLIDIDCDIPHACRIGERFLNRGPRYGRQGKRHSHYLARSKGANTRQFVDPITKNMIVELRSTGSQSVLPPSAHPSGERYEWERQEQPIDIEPVDLRRHVSIIASCAFIAQHWIANRHKFALALGAFLATNRVDEDFAIQLIDLITHAANDNEPDDRRRAIKDTYQRFANGEDVEFANTFKELLGEHAPVFVRTISEWLEFRRVTFHIHSEAALLARPAAPFLAKGLLVDGSLIALVSKPDIGKTFLALDLVLSLASGKDSWLDRRLLRHGPVLYVIGEGAGRFKLRVLAWKQVHRVQHQLPFYWIDQPVPLVNDTATKAFVKEVAPLKPTAIVFDTLSRCLMGADENSQADMGAAVAACDELRARTRAAVMLIHHMRKDGTVERGSSVLRGAVDTVLILDEKERGLITLTCDRQKDAEPFEPIPLVRRAVRLDSVFADDGEPESSCVIQLATDRDVDALTNGREHRLAELIRTNPGATKTWLVQNIGGNKADVLRQLHELEGRGAIRIKADGRAQRVYLDDLYTRI